MTREQNKAILRLFKSFVVDDSECTDQDLINLQCIKSGLFIKGNCSEVLVEDIIELYGRKPEEWNNTFHKSFNTVLNASIEDLIAQQVIHYFTVYGLEALGLANKDLVYIPKEELDIPELEEGINLILIKQITEQDLTNSLMTLLTSGIALSKQTIADIMSLSDYIDKNRFDEIKNREIRLTLYDQFKIVPNDPNAYLRYMIYKLTDQTLLIKNKAMEKSLQEADKLDISYLLDRYLEKPDGLEKLATIYLRYKRLFVALKRHDDSVLAKSINNKINRIAKKARNGGHKPINQPILDTLSTISTKTAFSKSRSSIEAKLKEVPVFRKARIIKGLRYRLSGNKEILYTIRNGKGFAKEKDTQISATKYAVQNEIINLVYGSLVKSVASKFKDKTVYLPDNIEYALPTSEKQFIGNIPEGSYIKIPRNKNIIIGIHWFNLAQSNFNSRVDLDLHMMNRGAQYGWSTMYRSEIGDIAFSGDMTQPDDVIGASEYFLIKGSSQLTSFLLTVNNYTANKANVPFSLIIAEKDEDEIEKNYIIDPNKIILEIPMVMEYDSNSRTNHQKTLGLVKVASDEIVFYFKNLSIGNSIITKRSETLKTAYAYLEKFDNYNIFLRDVLVKAGAKIVEQPIMEELIPITVKDDNNEEQILYKKVTKTADYDLSINNLNKETFIKLLTEA